VSDEVQHLPADRVRRRDVQALAYTGRDLSQQVTANLVGSPDLIREKIAGLAAIGVDHACGLMIPADSVGELEEQIGWFAEIALGDEQAGPCPC
jgi:alkanesulfonate monooxygenase SsuD/methylene tetrahydromethanopterin reductase-like flavin-dependent oxidoreductase (luciferase family)